MGDFVFPFGVGGDSRGTMECDSQDRSQKTPKIAGQKPEAQLDKARARTLRRPKEPLVPQVREIS